LFLGSVFDGENAGRPLETPRNPEKILDGNAVQIFSLHILFRFNFSRYAYHAFLRKTGEGLIYSVSKTGPPQRAVHYLGEGTLFGYIFEGGIDMPRKTNKN